MVSGRGEVISSWFHSDVSGRLEGRGGDKVISLPLSRGQLHAFLKFLLQGKYLLGLPLSLSLM